MSSHSRKTQTTTAARIMDLTNNRALRLLFCASGICGCYITYGILQERLYQAHGLGASFVLLTQCLANVVVSFLWLTLQSKLSSQSSSLITTKIKVFLRQNGDRPHRLLLVTAGCYVTAMVCSNEAIYYDVSYPIQVLAKSCKLIPTMLVGQLVDGGRSSYGRVEWCAALLICSGIVLFHQFNSINSINSNNKSSQEGGDEKGSRTATIGAWLLLASLAMDGVLNSLQNALKRCETAPDAAATMFYINVYALLYLFPFCLVTGQWTSGINQLLYYEPRPDQPQQQNVTISLLILNGTVALGQMFIFVTITWFSPVTTTVITTTRKYLTILISVHLYGHSFHPVQWLAVVIVFSGLYLAILHTLVVPQQPRRSVRMAEKKRD